MSKVVDNYVLENVVGSGQFGDVYKAKRLDKDEQVAIKTIRLDKFKNTPKLHEMTKNEVDILTKIDNPHIIKLHKVLKTQNHIYIIYELCNGGNLEQLLDQKKFLPEAEAIGYLKEILQGCKVLVQMKILHRDLKPSNILFHNDRIKVADFGFCKPLTTAFDSAETMVGSPIYMAPEILRGQPYNLRADLYSLGVVLYEMLYGVCPYEDSTIPGLLSQIQKGKLVFHNYNKISKATENLLRRMLEPLQAKRIEWSELFDYFLVDSIPDASPKNLDPNRLMVFPDVNLDNIIVKPGIDSELLQQNFIEKLLVLRLKHQYIWRTFKEATDNLQNVKNHRIILGLLKNLNDVSKEILVKLKNENQDLTKGEFDKLKTNFDYSRIMSILLKETSETNIIMNQYEELPSQAIDRNPITAVEFQVLVKEFVNDMLADKFSANVDESRFKNNLILANYFMDMVAVDEVINSFFNKSKSINDQSYLANLYNWNTDSIEEFVRFKLATF